MGNKRQQTAVPDSELYNPRFDPAWNRHMLYDLADWVNGMTFRDIHFSPDGKPVIKIAEIKNGITGQTKFTSAEYDPIYYITNGDMLFSWSGQPDTSIDVFWWNGPDGWLNQHIFKVFPKEICTQPYFFYILKYLNPNFVRIARNKQTTGLGHVTKKDLQAIKVGVPPRDQQRAIAHILGSLDDKIELNRQMNRTLEAIAAAIFKSWFVAFDPVRAKAEGRDPGLPKEIADLFPDRFEDSELGEIPKGWEVGSLGKLCEKPQYGYTASAQAEAVGPNFLRIKDINKLPWIEWDTVPYCEISTADQVKYQLKQGDFLIARMADPGHGVLIEEEVDAVFASYLIRFRPLDWRSGRYLQYWQRSHVYWNLINARKAGTTRASLNAKVLAAFPLLIPPLPLLEVFSKEIDPLRKQVVFNIHQSGVLSQLRDTLLPKLLSGELCVPDAEKFVEEADV